MKTAAVLSVVSSCLAIFVLNHSKMWLMSNYFNPIWSYLIFKVPIIAEKMCGKLKRSNIELKLYHQTIYRSISFPKSCTYLITEFHFVFKIIDSFSYSCWHVSWIDFCIIILLFLCPDHGLIYMLFGRP